MGNKLATLLILVTLALVAGLVVFGIIRFTSQSGEDTQTVVIDESSDIRDTVKEEASKLSTKLDDNREQAPERVIEREIIREKVILPSPNPTATSVSGVTRKEITIPGRPVNVQAFEEDDMIVVTWFPPKDDGGASITYYIVKTNPTAI